uniref:Spt20-like SEP domain-containing protein n=1 Tax=Oryza glumipatula TaxID=40148 RepID=A0A0D9Y2H6_9ORYZ
MVVSFRVSRRGRRFYPPPPPPPPAAAATAADRAAAPPEGSPLPPPLPWDVSALGYLFLPIVVCLKKRAIAIVWIGFVYASLGAAARSDVYDRDGVGSDDLDLEPSFALNLFPDGYSISDPGKRLLVSAKGMLLFLIGDDPQKRPYSKASQALFSDIEHGCLPQVILGDMPCKFRNGTIVCEVRDYRPFLSNAGDSSGDDFPIVNRVSLRLGTERVVKDLASVVNASWTYHDQLIAESTILRALQPRLNLDPTPCLERLQNSVKKIDLGLNKGRQKIKATSIDNTSADPPENCKPKEFITCEGAVVCIENETPEGLPRGILNGLSMDCPLALQIKKAQSAAGSDPDTAIQYSSTLMNSCVSCNIKQSASCTPAPDLLLQSQQAQIAILQVDHENEQPQKETVQLQNRKEHSNLPREIHDCQSCRPSNKHSLLSSESTKCHFQKSIRSSNNKGLNLVSPNQQPVKVNLDQTTGSKDMRVQQQKSLSAFTADCPHPSSETNNSCVEKIPKEVNYSTVRLKDRNLPSTVGPDNYCVEELKDRTTPSVISCSASSRKAPSKPPKVVTEPQPSSSKRKVLGVYTYLYQEIDSKEKRQKKSDTQSNTPCENVSPGEPDVTDGISSELGISPDIESCIGDPSYTIEPDIEKILSEVILTSKRHGLNERAAKLDGSERSCPLPPSKFFLSENTADIAYTQNEIMSNYPTGRTMNTRKIRRLSFHPVQYLCRGVVDECHYTLRLLESEAPDDHQVAVETIYGDEHHHANKLVDQFILLMRRDGYTLCNDIREQYEDAPQLGYLTGGYPQYPIARTMVINGSNNIGCTFHNGPPHVHANTQQQWMQAQQCPTLPSVQTNFWNPYHPGQQHYTGGILNHGGFYANRAFSMDMDQHQHVQQRQGVGWFPNGVFSMDLDQYQPVRQRQGVGQCLHCRHDIPGFFSERSYATHASTGSYNQWRQISTPLGGKVYQWDLPAFDRRVCGCTPVNYAGSSTPLSTLHPVGSPPMSSQSFGSNDGSLTSTPVQLQVPLGYQYMSHGMW